MTQGILSKDQNRIPVIGAVSSLTDSGSSAKSLQYDPTTRGLRTHLVGSELSSLPLPTGAATSAKQDTGNTSLGSIDTKLSSQATAANQTTANTYLAGIAGLVPAAYDYISLAYTGANLTTVLFKTGGSGGTTVATLTLAYSGSTLTSVTKT